MEKKVKLPTGDVINERRKNNNGYRYIKIAISLLVIAIGWLFIMNSRADIKIEKVQTGYTEIKEDISGIKKDIEWIKDYLQEMRRR